MLSTLLVLAPLVATVLGTPVPAGHAYQAPGPGDVRSPCPGLNTLANHGFLNRNGKDITVPQLVTGGSGLSIGPDFMTLIGGLALFSPAKPNGVSFDLSDLAEHNFPIEHDASLSREDYYFQHDDLDFYQPNYNDFISHFAGQTNTNLNTSAAARYQRVNDSLTENPTVVYGPQEFVFSYGESGLYTQTMGMSPLALSAPVAYVESLFVQQRLPYELGWSPSVLPITLNSLGQFALEMYSITPEALPLGIEVFTEGTYREVLAQFLAVLQKGQAES